MRVADPHIQAALESIRAIDSYRPAGEEAFLSDAKTQDAVLMRLLDIGEILNRVRQDFIEFWEAHATDGWQKAIGLRNVVAHDYGSVDFKLIWTVITRDLTVLAETLSASLDTDTNRHGNDEPQP